MRDSGLFAEVMEQALTSGTLVRFRAEGSSMHPTIRDGEVVTAAPVSAVDVVRGDVVLCRHGGRVLAHRVVAISARRRDPQFALRGDRYDAADEVVAADAIVARIVAVERGGRTIPVPGAGGWLIRRLRAASAPVKRAAARAIRICTSGGTRTLRPRF